MSQMYLILSWQTIQLSIMKTILRRIRKKALNRVLELREVAALRNSASKAQKYLLMKLMRQSLHQQRNRFHRKRKRKKNSRNNSSNSNHSTRKYYKLTLGRKQKFHLKPAQFSQRDHLKIL
jgi:hypothetical protein